MKKIITIFLIALFINISFIIDNCKSQWLYQQIGASGTPYDMKFFDANTGIISYSNLPSFYRTTNGGQNWTFINNYIRANNFEKVNDSTMFAVASSSTVSSMIYRTFNKGLTWDSVANFDLIFSGISFINKDTGWISGFNGNSDMVWRTTNGGLTIQAQATNIGWRKIFFLKYKIGGEYYGWCSEYGAIYKTTNSGVNWFLAGGVPHYDVTQLAMYDENIGWISNGDTNAYKTTNGGLNWVAQQMPRIPNMFLNQFDKFRIINQNIVYAVGGTRWFGPGIGDGIIWKTTNGGTNWGFQQPDTLFPITKYWAIDFIDSVRGWAYGYGSQGGVQTINGGGPITKISMNNEHVSYKYVLYQNYPNPFNASTRIELCLSVAGFASLKIFDITGKEVATLANKKLHPGTYQYRFDASGLASGVYIYTLQIKSSNGEPQKVFSRTMLLLK